MQEITRLGVGLLQRLYRLSLRLAEGTRVVVATEAGT